MSFWHMWWPTEEMRNPPPTPPCPASEYVIECSPKDWPTHFQQWKDVTLKDRECWYGLIDKIIHDHDAHYITVVWYGGLT